MSVALLQVEELCVEIATAGGPVRAVDGLGFSLQRGETLGLVGESGSGKSMTALAILGLLPPVARVAEGDVRLEGRSLLEMPAKERRSISGNRIAMIFQDPMTSLNPVYRVGTQVAEPLRLHRGLSRKAAWREAVSLLSSVGIPRAEERARSYPHEFSGGMLQRVLIAMALACEPDVLIADEPSSSLDVTVQAQILELLREVQACTQSAMILISHDLGVVAEVADRVLVMYGGRAAEYGEVDQVFEKPLHPYTKALISCLPECAAEGGGRLQPIKGQPPSLVDMPAGCAFNPRCDDVEDVCERLAPSLAEFSRGHFAACHTLQAGINVDEPLAPAVDSL